MISDNNILDNQTSASNLDPTLPGTVQRPEIVADRPPLPLDSDERPVPPGSGPLLAYLHAFRRRWFLAISLGLFCGIAAAGAAWYLSRQQYTSTVVFRVAANEEQGLFNNPRSAERNNYEIFRSTTQQLMRIDYVIKAALRNEQVKSLPIIKRQADPDRWLTESIVTQFPRDSELMNLSVPADSPDATAWLTASVATAFIEEVVARESEEREFELAQMRATLAELNDELTKKNANLNELAKTLGSKDSASLSNQQRLAQDHWMAVYREWITVQSEVARLETDLELKRAELERWQSATGEAAAALISPLEIDMVNEQDPVLADAQFELDRINQQRDYVNEKGTSAQIQKHESLHAEKLKEIETVMQKRRSENESFLRRRAMAVLNGEVSQLATALDAQKRLEKRLSQEEVKLRESVKEVGGSTLEVENLQKQVDSLTRLIDPLDQQIRQLEYEKKRQNRITLVTRLPSLGDQEKEKTVAEVVVDVKELAKVIRPGSADRSPQLRNTAGAGLGGFGMVVALILFLEVRAKRVNSSTDVTDSLGLSVIGAVPMIPNGFVRNVSMGTTRYRRWRIQLNESMRGVMVRLLHGIPSGESRVVMVSSACSGEGKSTLATNLAVAIARAGYRTLLVDFDLRKPSLNGLFDISAEPGVAEVLRCERDLIDTIQKVDTANLDVLPAGLWSPNDLAVLANGATTGVFERLRQEYEFVIVDGAPVLGVPESQLLCRHADIVLLSVLRDFSSAPKIRAACETLANFGVRSLCAVVSGTSIGDHSHYYAGYGYDEPLE